MIKEASSYYINGAALSPLWVAPFAGLLLSIAFLPLIMPGVWHRHFGKIAAFWAALFLVPAVFSFGYEATVYEVVHTFMVEYIPFVILLLALFTIGGGVRITGALKGTPMMNTAVLGLGTCLASFMGTTGAAMLLIRPIIVSNIERHYKVHVIVFFIFLVANVGGSLTPLGDPPLFLGFLNGVEFFWPMKNMLLPMLMVSITLLTVFYFLDRYYAKKETQEELCTNLPDLGAFQITGKINFLLLLGVLGAVIMSGIWKPGVYFDFYGTPVALQNIVRDLVLLSLTYLSLRLTSKKEREKNGFSWFPMVEVAMLFAAIFTAMIPALKILKAGDDGSLGFLIQTLSDEQGNPVNIAYFWLTGILSAFLDNAPTYLVFFNSAGGDAQVLKTVLNDTLLAISMGAVFFGALSYIGNAPNFMVKAIAEQRGIKMPSFFGFMIWSCIFLLPIYLVVGWVFL